MTDETETLRRQRLVEINAEPGDRDVLEARYGQVWDPKELERDFTVEGYLAPFVVVVRKWDGQLGSLEFQHHARFYFNFVPDRR